jgi:putative DNA primase/helicase
VLILLQRKEIDIVKIKAELNRNGFLLPFINGVLNCKTKVFLPHSKTLYSTHIISVKFSTDTEVKDSPMSEFLKNLVSDNGYTLNIIRGCLYLLFTNTLKYQVALYIYGPGGTGKTTFANMLLYLFGTEAGLSTSLTTIGSRFGSNLIRNKLLLVINELPLLLGTEPSILKSITGGEAIMGEEKFRTATQFVPTVFLVITSNSL